MHVHKFKVSKGGYKEVKLPKSAAELMVEANRCEELTKLLNRIFGAMQMSVFGKEKSNVRGNVRKDNGRWLPEPPTHKAKPDPR